MTAVFQNAVMDLPGEAAGSKSIEATRIIISDETLIAYSYILEDEDLKAA